MKLLMAAYLNIEHESILDYKISIDEGRITYSVNYIGEYGSENNSVFDLTDVMQFIAIKAGIIDTDAGEGVKKSA